MTESSQQLDTRVEIATPENIAFQYRIAGPFRRLPAYLLDMLFRALFLYGVMIVVSLTVGGVGARMTAMGVIMITWFLLAWFYGGLFETIWNGQTPGKRLMHLRVLTVEGEPIAGWQAVLRNILRAADSLPLVPFPGVDMPLPSLPLYMFGLFSCLATSRYQRLGDLVCGTMVVVEQRDLLSGVVPVVDRDIIAAANELPPMLHVSRSLARSLAGYLDRRRFFSPARREEMSRALGQAIAERYQLPPVASYDRLLCALYYRAFIADRALDEDAGQPGAGSGEPFDFAELVEVVPEASETWTGEAGSK